MMKLIVKLSPIALKQNFFLLKDGECVEQASAPTPNISRAISNMSKVYNLDKIEMYGGRDYCLKFARELKSQYDLNNVEIEIK